MTRVLNVIQQSGRVGEALTARLSAGMAALQNEQQQTGATPNEHAWLLLGGEALRDAADLAGLRREQCTLIPKPAGLSLYVPGAMRRITRELERADRVRCWDDGADRLVRQTLGVGHAEPMHDAAQLCPAAKEVIDADAARLAQGPAPERSALRQRWGVADDAIVIALLVDEPERLDPEGALLIVTLLEDVLRAYDAQRGGSTLITHPQTHNLRSAVEQMELLRMPDLIRQDAQIIAPWLVLGGCDMALAPEPSLAGLSILWANAMGVPVIAAPDPAMPMLSELPHVQVTRSGKARHLVHDLTERVMGQVAYTAQAGL